MNPDRYRPTGRMLAADQWIEDAAHVVTESVNEYDDLIARTVASHEAVTEWAKALDTLRERRAEVVRQLHATGQTHRSIAILLNLSHQTVAEIINRK